MQFSYIQPRLKKVINITEIQTIHYYEFDERFSFEGEKHDFWEMVYVDSGMVEIQRDEETLILKQGEVIFHEPNEFHTIKSYHGSPNVFVVSFVCKSTVMSCFRKYKALLNIALRPVVSSIISEAENTYNTNEKGREKVSIKQQGPIGGEQLVKTYLEQLLILLARDISYKDDTSIFPSKESMETYLVAEIKEYMKGRLTEKVDAGGICGYFGYSRAYVSRLFKSQCGTSLMKYYMEKKIELSKTLIREKRYNISQISNMLSFDNPQYFSRVFKKVTGLTPSEYAHSLKIK